MTGEIVPKSPEFVTWNNVPEPLGWMGRVRRFLYETARIGTYTPEVATPPTTSIPASEIDTLQDEGLRTALRRQYESRLKEEPFSVVPFARIASCSLTHFVVIRRGSLELNGPEPQSPPPQE